MQVLTRSLCIWRDPIVQIPSNDSKLPKYKTDNTSIIVRMIAVASAFFANVVYLWRTIPLLDLTYLGSGAVVSIALASLYGAFESMRATSALNRIAVDQFISEEPVPTYIMNHLRTHPAAVKELCNRPEPKLSKISMDGASLLEFILFTKYPNSSLEDFAKVPLPICKEERNKLLDNYVIMSVANHKDEDNRLAILKLLLAKGVQLKMDRCNYFLEMVTRSLPIRHISYVLKNDFIKPGDLSNEELFQCWTSMKDLRVTQLLVQKGFDINVQNSEGQTPLQWAEANNKDKLIRLLQKANDPTPPTNFKPFILDLRKPAISVGGKHRLLEVRGFDIILRTMLVAIPIFTTLLAVAVKALIFFPVALPLLLLPVAYYKFEWKRAIEKLNALALDVFKGLLPSSNSMAYIAQNELIVDQLLASDSDITKQSESGLTLWHYLIFGLERIPFETKLSIFKKLAGRFFAPELPIESRYANFIKAAESGHFEFVEHLLVNKMIRAEELSPHQMFNCWIALREVKSIELLKTHDFDVNVRNENGLTPLLHMLTRTPPLLFSRKQIKDYDFIKAFLKAGADAYASAPQEFGSPKNAFELTQNQAILNLLKGIER
ncbi:MAG: hypothetical protein ACHQUC_07280 [Chlamydiales bacterium]